MMRGMITFEVDRIKKVKLKTEETQADEEVLMNMLKKGCTGATADLKDALYQYIENFLTDMTLEGTSDNIYKEPQMVESNTGMYVFAKTVLK